jgi:hypothetical protein
LAVLPSRCKGEIKNILQDGEYEYKHKDKRIKIRRSQKQLKTQTNSSNKNKAPDTIVRPQFLSSLTMAFQSFKCEESVSNRQAVFPGQ